MGSWRKRTAGILLLLFAAVSAAPEVAGQSVAGADALIVSRITRYLSDSTLGESIEAADADGGILVSNPPLTARVLLDTEVRLARESRELLLLRLLSNRAVVDSGDFPRTVGVVLVRIARIDDWFLIAEVLRAAHAIGLDGTGRATLDVAARIVRNLGDGSLETTTSASPYSRAAIAVAECATAYPSVPLAELLVTIGELSRDARVVDACRRSASAVLQSMH